MKYMNIFKVDCDRLKMYTIIFWAFYKKTPETDTTKKWIKEMKQTMKKKNHLILPKGVKKDETRTKTGEDK